MNVMAFMELHRCRVDKLLSTFALTIALIACGGGEDGQCGDKNAVFGISFSASSYSLTRGNVGTITSTITPESCRGEMKFAINDGTLFGSVSSNVATYLPPGMSIVNGNITGTPTTVGQYKFAIYISGVNGYKEFLGSLIYPHSGAVTVNIIP